MGTSEEAITNGDDDSDTPPRNATVLILSAGSACSGSLITSDLVLTARHCNVQALDTVWFGPDNAIASDPSFTANARAKRRVTDVFNASSTIVTKNASVDLMARDVTILRFTPPITMQASPQKPSFKRPPMIELAPGSGIFAGALNGGISGYGDKAVLSGGAILITTPNQRQVATSSEFGVVHEDFDNGYGVWFHTVNSDIESHEPHTNSGDSGGPLFRTLDYYARDVLGVCSSGGLSSNWPCPESICGEDTSTDIYADITAPAMKNWIESIVDRNGDGRWEGEVDYVRAEEGTPGCDVKLNPGCDPGCDAVNDPDCDLVYKDNCPHDYNPDQMNSDSLDPLDTSFHDSGDICDLCRYDAIEGGNCNADAEVLNFGGPRPHLLEDSVLGPNPLSPTPLPIVQEVELTFRGDRCDTAPCTQTGAQSINLDANTYGKPDATTPECALMNNVGGTCLFKANAQIQHDGRYIPPYSVKGKTGYRFCKCDGPFLTQDSRIANCFKTGPECPIFATEFTTSTKVKELTVDPPFSPIPDISPPELGTSDTFTDTPKTKPPSFRWEFENDICAITKLFCPKPALPLTDATAAAINIKGLVWSNVRAFPPTFSSPDLNSFWLPMTLSIGYGGEGGHWDFATESGGYGWGCPGCPFGLSTPWQLVTSPVLPIALVGITANGLVDVTDMADPLVLTLWQSVAGTPGRALVISGEHSGWLAERAAPFAPRWVVADLESLTFVGAIGQDEVGQLLPVRGRVLGIDLAGLGSISTKTPEMQPCWDTRTVSCPRGGHSAGIAASLSAVRQTLYVARREITDLPGPAETRLHLFNVLTETWSELALTGADLPEIPLAASYDAQADALFLVDRTSDAKGTVRLFRIRFDGRVDLIAEGFGLGHDHAAISLTTSEDGALLLSATRDQPLRFGILQIDVFGKKAKLMGGYKGKGPLRGTPFLTERALHLLVPDAGGNVKALEIDPKELQPPHGGPDHVFD